MDSTRRGFLGFTGATISLGIAGCLSNTGSKNTSDREEQSNGDDRHALGEAVIVDTLGEVVVDSVAVQRSVIHHHLWRDIYEPEGAQMLVVRGRIEADTDPADIEFQARIDGELIESKTRTWLNRDDRLYALSLPVGSATNASIALQTGNQPEWEFSEAVGEEIGKMAEFHIHDAVIREETGETVLDLTVENKGDRDAIFRGVVKHGGAEDADAPVRFPIVSGETVTQSIRNSAVDSWPPDVTFGHEITPKTREFAIY